MEGLTSIQSRFGPGETLSRLEGEINARGMTVFARVNHSALAAEAGLELRPTEVVLFGNPRGGTPLMQANQTIGIDLPLKALVWQDDAGKTWLSYNEPAWLAMRHNVSGAEALVAAMGAALRDMTSKAAGETPQPLSAAGKPPVKETSAALQKPVTPLVEPPRRGSTAWLLVIGVVIIGIAGLFAYARGWLRPHVLTPARVVDRFEELNGSHPGFRRNHAKGVCVTGYFESNGQGAALCKASVFQPGRVPVLGRFSFGGGQPYVVDTASAVRGLGILFQLPHGEEWRAAMVNLPVFPVRTAQGFYDLMLASAPVPATGKPDPARMQAFMAKYPESAKAFQLLGGHPPSSGFDNTTFNSLNAFRFANASGAVASVRWSMVPAQPLQPAGVADSSPTGTNELFDALIAGIHRHPLEWHLMITTAEPGDSTDDATIPWPPERKQVDAGTLTIDAVESDDVSPTRDINFDPLVLPNGMAASDDPLLSARSAIYSKAFTRREGEEKNPSAISAAETQK